MKRSNQKGAHVATSYYQFLRESKILSKEEAEGKPEDIHDDQSDTDLESDTSEEELPPVKKKGKKEDTDSSKFDYKKMKESLLEFERILNGEA